MAVMMAPHVLADLATMTAPVSLTIVVPVAAHRAVLAILAHGVVMPVAPVLVALAVIVLLLISLRSGRRGGRNSQREGSGERHCDSSHIVSPDESPG